MKKITYKCMSVQIKEENIKADWLLFFIESTFIRGILKCLHTEHDLILILVFEYSCFYIGYANSMSMFKAH